MPESDLLSGLIGSLVGGFTTLAGVILANEHNVKLKDYEIERQARGVLSAIAIEMRASAEAYRRDIGTMLEANREGEPFFVTLQISDNYGLAYKSNLHLIGVLANETLRKLIIETHTAWTLLIDLYRINNNYVAGYLDAKTRTLETGKSEFEHRAQQFLEASQMYAPRLKQLHTLCLNRTDRMLIAIEQFERDNPVKKPLFLGIRTD